MQMINKHTSMSGNQSRSNVTYPGASKKLIFINEKKRNNNELLIKNHNQPDGWSSPELILANTDTANQDSGKKEELFDLDWIDYKRGNITPTSERSTNDRSGANSRSESRIIQSNRPSSRNYNQDLIKLKSGNMPSNLINTDKSRTNLGSTGKKDSDSTALIIDDELLNTTSGDYFDDSNLDGQLVDGAPEVKQTLSDDYNHLDEPILDTLMRDLSGIYNKMKIIALPLSSYDIYKVVLRGWDLWGPLLLCTFLAFNLHNSSSQENHSGPHFADVFVLVWFGSCIVSLNYRLLSITSANNRTVSNQLAQSKSLQPHQPSTSSSHDDGNSSDTASGVKDRSQSNIIMSSPYEAPFQTLLSPPSTFQLMCVFGYCLVAPCFGLILLKLLPFDRLFFERIIVGILFGFAWPTFCSVRILIRYQHPEKRALAIYPIGLFYFILSCMIILNH